MTGVAPLANPDDPTGDAESRAPSRPLAVPPSPSYLLARLTVIESRVRALVALRRRDDPSPDDPFRGLYLSDEQIDLVLAGGAVSEVIEWDDAATLAAIETDADDVEANGTTVRLRNLARRAGLDALDVDLLLVALAPDLDVRFERLYGYLNDDVTRRRATISLAIELAGTSPWLASTKARLSAEGPLVSSSLVVIEEPERPYLARSLRVPDRVAAHLLGGNTPDPVIANLLATPTRGPVTPLISSLAGVIQEGVSLIYLRERAGSSAASVAAAAFELAGRPSVTLDLSHLGPSDDVAEVTRLVWREGLLEGAGVIAGPIDVLDEHQSVALRTLANAGHRPSDLGGGGGSGGANGAAVVPFALYGRSPWEPAWSRVVPLVAEVEPESATQRLKVWQEYLGMDGPPDLEGSDVTDQFLLSAEQVSRAVEAARLQARLQGESITLGHLRSGARAQNGAGLERLARRIHPHVVWDDLVLAPPTIEALRSLAARARRRSQVLDEWGMRPGGGRGRGITVLFAGPSGTGKTMSAEVVAGDLGFDLYTVNLATVVDKYVGETEKNLERIFTEADGVNAVLLFDEADAIFGKRSEVKDANDRYANIEVAYLLQRMETFDGIAILATNLRANVDDAFTRRLDLIVDFPEPDVDLRRSLWDRCLGAGVPRGDDLDLDFCAKSFELSGGNIRSVAMTAAYLAADSGREVTMLDLIKAIQEEYRKLGRLVVSREFGHYLTSP